MDTRTDCIGWWLNRSVKSSESDFKEDFDRLFQAGPGCLGESDGDDGMVSTSTTSTVRLLVGGY